MKLSGVIKQGVHTGLSISEPQHIPSQQLCIFIIFFSVVKVGGSDGLAQRGQN